MCGSPPTAYSALLPAEIPILFAAKQFLNTAMANQPTYVQYICQLFAEEGEKQKAPQPEQPAEESVE